MPLWASGISSTGADLFINPLCDWNRYEFRAGDNISDPATGLLHARARQYSPTLGRYIIRNNYKQNPGWEYSVRSEYRLNVELISRGRPSFGSQYIDSFGQYAASFVEIQGLDPSGQPGGLVSGGGLSVVPVPPPVGPPPVITIDQTVTLHPGSEFWDWKMKQGKQYGTTQGATQFWLDIAVTGKATGCCCQFNVGPGTAHIDVHVPTFKNGPNDSILTHERGHQALMRQLTQKFATAQSSNKTCCYSEQQTDATCAVKALALKASIEDAYATSGIKSGNAFEWELGLAGAHSSWTSVEDVLAQLADEMTEQLVWSYRDWTCP